MRVVEKKVYYCDFCKKHALRPLTTHEERCTGNPDRECYWGGGSRSHIKAGDLRAHIEWCKQFRSMDDAAISGVRDRVNGCPPCMLAVIRQARPEDVEPYRWWLDFDYDEEKERFNQEQLRADERAAMYG